MFTFLSTVPVWEYKISWQLSKQISKLFFQMSAQVFLLLVKLKWEERPFWNRKVRTYPINYFLHVGVILTIMKVFIILFLLVEIGKILEIFISNFLNQYPLLSVECPGIFSSRPNWRGEEDLLWRAQEEGPYCEITPKSTWLS